SALDRTGREAGDVVAKEEDVDHHDGDAREQRAGHERAPEVDVAADQVRGDADHGGLVRNNLMRVYASWKDDVNEGFVWLKRACSHLRQRIDCPPSTFPPSFQQKQA